jgi:hypothetical protein
MNEYIRRHARSAVVLVGASSEPPSCIKPSWRHTLLMPQYKSSAKFFPFEFASRICVRHFFYKFIGDDWVQHGFEDLAIFVLAFGVLQGNVDWFEAKCSVEPSGYSLLQGVTNIYIYMYISGHIYRTYI